MKKLWIVLTQCAALFLSEPTLLLCPICEIRLERCQCEDGRIRA